jgi:hypothetical protein
MMVIAVGDFVPKWTSDNFDENHVARLHQSLQATVYRRDSKRRNPRRRPLQNLVDR